MEWSYEKEYRMIVDLNQSDVQMMSERAIYCSIENITSSLSVTMGPYAKIKNRIDYPELWSIFSEKIWEIKVKDSVLRNNLNIKLCKECTFENF